MTRSRSFRPRLVGVIFSENDLARALTLPRLPDLFELRLDGLHPVIAQLPDAIRRLRRPLIITARSPAEGGKGRLPLERRRELLLRFLPYAALVDVELRSASGLSAVRERARAKKVQVILSIHDSKTTPKSHELQSAVARACLLGADIFKVAVCTDRAPQVERLLKFIRTESSRIPISAMGLGRLGSQSRARLAGAGSVLNYAHLGEPVVEGQPSLAELRANCLSIR